MPIPDYDFLKRAGRIFNSGQARALFLTGNIQDLFFLPGKPVKPAAQTASQLPEGRAEPSPAPAQAGPGEGAFAPLLDFLAASWSVAGKIVVVYELNGPVRFVDPAARDRLRDAWVRWKSGLTPNDRAIRDMVFPSRAKQEGGGIGDTFERNLEGAIGKPTFALEFLRQLCLLSRSSDASGPILPDDLLILIEGVDLLLPEAPIANLSDADRHRVSICRDWFSDPAFADAGDAVALLSESRSAVNRAVASLPQLLDVEIPSPGIPERLHYIEWFDARLPEGRKLRLPGGAEELAGLTAGLSLQALRQLLLSAAHGDGSLTAGEVVRHVEAFIRSEVGEDVVEFKRPTHRIDDLVGFEKLKTFLRAEFIPRVLAEGDMALPGAAVGGPIGVGKTFIFEAVASELGRVVLTLKNIRSQWYGQTDVIFERLRRALIALHKVVIIVDEADTQFGGVGEGSHETERRLTGKVQAMMSDPALRGRVVWLLMTARIHRLSPDIRRPGRVGDLIIPVLDPEGEDRRAFARWMISPAVAAPAEPEVDEAVAASAAFSAAEFAAVRSDLKARAKREKLDLPGALAAIRDRIPPDIEATRRYQTLQALMNCTRRSLLPETADLEKARVSWREELLALERRGVE